MVSANNTHKRLRLGGFVIHGNNIDTLPACIQSLQAVCDEVIAVDSQSTDGSKEYTEKAGTTSYTLPWNGYGAARAYAAQKLSHCDYLFFLDSDEHLEQRSIKILTEWKESQPTLPQYQIIREDWAFFPQKKFLFRKEKRTRLVQPTYATWTSDMVVHEALPKRTSGLIPVTAVHRFATSLQDLEKKQQAYALLWALRAYQSPLKKHPSPIKRLEHTFRNAFIKGAFFRGGLDGLALSWSVAQYHGLKYDFLKKIPTPEYQHLLQLYDTKQFDKLFLSVRDFLTHP